MSDDTAKRLSTVQATLELLSTVRGTDDGWVSRDWLHCVARMGLDALPEFEPDGDSVAAFNSQFRDIPPTKQSL